MIIPTKGIRPDKSLLYIGGQILSSINESTTVSGAWEALSQKRSHDDQEAPPTFDWFILALDLLYACGAIEISNGLISRTVKI